MPGSRQDGWRIQISDNYYITKLHSRCISISKASETPGLYQGVLSFFYVTKYCVSDPFIALEGIPTKELLASKKELASDHRQYYLIDMRDDTLYGPYDTDSAMMDLEMIRTVDMSLAWEIVP